MSNIKKSMMYRLAALAVLKDDDIPHDDTLDIIRELGSCERLAKYSEERDAQKAAEAAK